MNLKAWWDQGKHVEIDGQRFFTNVQGAGRTLVFLHGFPTSSHDWAEVFTDLARDFRCVTFDDLGYGASDKPEDANYSSFEQTRRALAVLEKLGVTKATIVAHDLGGILLQQIVHRGDFALEQAIFSNSSVFAELYRPTAFQERLVDPAQGKLLAKQINREAAVGLLTTLFPKYPLSPERAEDLWTAISQDNGHYLWPQHLVYMAERAADGAAWVESMRHTKTPLGFIYGLGDQISGAQILERAAVLLPSARRVGLPDLGHWPQLESPSEYAAALRTVLHGASPAGG